MKLSSKNYVRGLNILHILNDGFLISLPLLLPFVSKDLGINLTEVGILGSLLNALSVFLALPAGYLASRFGGFRILIVSVLLYSLGYVGTSITSTFALLSLSFFIAGIGFGVFHPIAFSLVAQLSKKSNLGKNMGNFTAIGDIGRVAISAGITFIVVFIGWRMTSLIYGIMALIFFSLFYFFYLSNGKRVKTKKGEDSNTNLKKLLGNSKFMLASITGTIDSFASSSLYIFIPFLLIQKGVVASFLGSFTAAFFIGNLAGKSILGRFVDRYGSTSVLITSNLLMALFIFLLATSSSMLLIVVFSIILGALTKGTVPVINSMVAESITDSKNYNKAFGLSSLIVSSATSTAPVVLGYIANNFGIVDAFNTSAIVALLAIIPATLFRAIDH